MRSESTLPNMTNSRPLIAAAVVFAWWASDLQPHGGNLMAHGGNLMAQQTCATAESTMFDFWLGEWELSWPGGQGGTPEDGEGRGTNVITRILDGCIIQESFRSATGFHGMSVSSLNPRTGRWQQTWVDNRGGYLVFSGEFRDGEMELRTDEFTNPSGDSQINRMLWTNITSNSLDWRWQRSLDGGETWENLWEIRYVRRE